YKPTIVEEKLDMKNEMKARGTLLIAFPNKDQLKFHSYQDVKLLMEAIEKRYGGNKESKKSNSSQLARKDLEQINPDDLEERDLQWEMAMLTIRARRHFARKCRAPKNQENRGREYGRKTMSIENLTENALIAQDGIGGYDWSYQAEEEHPTNFALIEFTSSGSSGSSSNSDYKKNVRSRSDKGYHAVPLPYTGNYIPPKPDLMFIDEQVESESVDVVSTVSSSVVKTVESKVESVDVKNKGVKTKPVWNNNFSPPIIKDWNSNDESEVEFEHKVEVKTVRPCIEKIKFVKTAREKVEKVETPKQYKHYLRGNQRNWNNLMSKRLGKNQENVKSRSDKGYHAVPPPYTGNYIPPKPDLMFIDEQVKSKSVDFVFTVSTSAIKTVESKFESVDVKNKGMCSTIETKLVRKNNFSPPIIEDWISDDESEVEFEPKVKDKIIRPSIEKIKFVKTARETEEKLLDESQVLLRVPRKDNIYIVDLKSVDPTGGLTCLFAKATTDESNLWHRRLGHINYKTMNKLVRGNLVKGQAEKKKEPKQEYILIPIYITDPLISQGPNDSVVDAGKKATEVDANQVSDIGGQDTRINAAGTPASTNAFEKHPFGRFSPFKNAFSLPHLPIVTPINVTGIFANAYDDEAVEEEVNMNNVVSSYTIPDALLTKFLNDHPKDQTLVDLPKDKWAIGTKWVFRNKKDERGIVIKNKPRLVAQGHTQEEGINYDEVFATVARIKAIRLFLAYASFKDFVVYQMNVKSAFLYGKIEEEVYVCQTPGFEDLDFPDKVYKVEKAFYQLHQAPRACQDKYVANILKKFDFSTIKTASTLIEPNKALVKDAEAEDVDVHLYRSMIRSLMYLTTFSPDITFDVYACVRDSPFDLEAYSDSDYDGASLDRKSTTGEYVAAASCYRQVLWIQNQMLDMGSTS
nr:copia protein [Tanacetum cinerariifolium]